LFIPTDPAQEPISSERPI